MSNKKVVCINTKELKYRDLTLNKQYEILKVRPVFEEMVYGVMVTVVNDFGQEKEYCESRFKEFTAKYIVETLNKIEKECPHRVGRYDDYYKYYACKLKPIGREDECCVCIDCKKYIK